MKLVACLGLPFSVVTDWDPLDGTKPALGKERTLGIWEAFLEVSGIEPMSAQERVKWMETDFYNFYRGWSNAGIFLNDRTFEVAVAHTPNLQNALLDILNEQGFGATRKARIDAWKAGNPIDPGHLLSMVSDIGKGRLSSKLAKKAVG
nr:hypothetical protein [Enterovibrio nigricans]